MSKQQLEKAIEIAPEPSSLQVSIPQKAIVLKGDLLASAATIREVKSPVQQEAAVAVIADMKAFTRAVKKLGLDARRPFKDVQDAVIAKERELTTEVEAEIDRAERLVAAYQAELRRQQEAERQEAERKRQEAIREEQRRAAEAQRVERERVEAEQRAERERVEREKEAQRQRDEIERLERQRKEAEERAALAHTQAAKDAAAAETARIQKESAEAEARAARARQESAEAEARAAEEKSRLAQEAFEAELAAAEAAEDATAICQAPIPEDKTGVTGASVSEEFDIEFTDLHALYAAHRQCVDLTGRKQAVKDLIRVGIREIPGVRLIAKTKVAVRAAKQSSLLV